MSFDIYLATEYCKHCGRGELWDDVGNVTHNVNDMVEKVFAGIGWAIKSLRSDHSYQERSWGRLDGHVGEDLLPYLKKMLTWFNDHEIELGAMNPPNGWGSTRCVHRILKALIRAIEDNPKGIVGTSG